MCQFWCVHSFDVPLALSHGWQWSWNIYFLAFAISKLLKADKLMSRISESPIDVSEIQFHFAIAKMLWTWSRSPLHLFWTDWYDSAQIKNFSRLLEHGSEGKIPYWKFVFRPVQKVLSFPKEIWISKTSIVNSKV